MHIPSLFCNGLEVDDSLHLLSKQENADVRKVVNELCSNQGPINIVKCLYYQEQLLVLHGLYPLGCSQKVPECQISDINSLHQIFFQTI